MSKVISTVDETNAWKSDSFWYEKSWWDQCMGIRFLLIRKKLMRPMHWNQIPSDMKKVNGTNAWESDSSDIIFSWWD